VILASALLLFNEQGTAAVSTNHIAHAAGVSPGNLYYHFRSKEHVIRELVRVMNGRWASEIGLPTDRAPRLGDLDKLLSESFTLIAEYRFYYRDLTSLLRADPELAELYRQQRTRAVADFEGLAGALAQGGVMPAPPSGRMPVLAQLCWLATEFWLQNLEVQGLAPDGDAVQQGLAQIHAILRIDSP